MGLQDKLSYSMEETSLDLNVDTVNTDSVICVEVSTINLKSRLFIVAMVRNEINGEERE